MGDEITLQDIREALKYSEAILIPTTPLDPSFIRYLESKQKKAKKEGKQLDYFGIPIIVTEELE